MEVVMILKHVTEETPLPAVFIGICSGILLCSFNGIFLGFAALFAFFLVDTRRIAHFSAGMFMGIISILSAPQWAGIPDGQHIIEGTVRRAGFAGGTYKVLLDDFMVDQGAFKGLAQLSIYTNVGGLGTGDRIRAHAKIKRPRPFGNSGEFDYREYLQAQGIVLTGSISDYKDIEIQSRMSSCGLRDKLVSRLSALARPEAEVLKAILAGDRSGLTYSLRDAFAALGIAHILAISGLHMGIIILMGYGAVFSVLRLVPPLALRLDVPLMAKAGGIIAAGFYTVFAGATVPTLRAAIMAGCVLGSMFLFRKANLLESLAFAGIVILIIWPLELFSVSFLLSFAAVLGIIAAYSGLEGFPKWVVFAGIPLGATVFTLPVVVYVFGFVSPWGLLSNIVIVPFFSLVLMPVAITGLILLPLSNCLSSYMFSVSLDAIGLILKTSQAFGTLKPVARPWIIWVLACYLGLIIAFFSRKSGIRSIIVSISCVFVFFIPFIAKAYLNSSGLCFDFISVGQGDSTLITRRGHAVLIDAGGSYSGFDTGRFVVGPHLLRKGITRIDLVVMTHAHPDHIGGMAFIMERFEIEQVWNNTVEDWNRYTRDVTKITKKKSIPVKTAGLGDVLDLHGMKIAVLNPPGIDDDILVSKHRNLHSIVLKISDHTMKGIFMADADGFGEIRISRLEDELRADVLKVAHHGSRNSCCDMFLSRVKPKVAVVSCGYDNIYNLPSREALSRLEEKGVEVFSTDRDGEIVVYKDKMGIKVKSHRPRADNEQDRHDTCIFNSRERKYVR
ncbi:MAG TPA: DNA internalization-related competence protein ComEC/Rec2 [Deltaproteobacteria bacterium]|nr:DNA internalization-related competence protein ComEC/Rec2 [Deltaproteobacteria bacterium]